MLESPLEMTSEKKTSKRGKLKKKLQQVEEQKRTRQIDDRFYEVNERVCNGSITMEDLIVLRAAANDIDKQVCDMFLSV